MGALGTDPLADPYRSQQVGIYEGILSNVIHLYVRRLARV